MNWCFYDKNKNNTSTLKENNKNQPYMEKLKQDLLKRYENR